MLLVPARKGGRIDVRSVPASIAGAGPVKKPAPPLAPRASDHYIGRHENARLVSRQRPPHSRPPTIARRGRSRRGDSTLRTGPYFFEPKRARELPHRIQFLLDSLRVPERNIARRGSNLIIAEGRSVEVVPRLAKTWRVDHVAAHYLKYLTDGDWAQNNAGWQWSAGCGCDAQPYFRVFNPVTQGKKFDPDGDYVRRWVPELAGLSATHIHAPWAAPASVLEEAGIAIGRDSPEPIVDHREARTRFLELAQRHLKR